MNSIRFSENTYNQLKQYLFQFTPLEAAAYLICGFYNTSDGIHFTVREVIYPEENEYEQQLTYHLRISAWFFNKVISKAESENLTVIICHSHPCSDDPSFSPSDDNGERASSKTLYECLEGKPCASLLFGKANIIGRIWVNPHDRPLLLDQIRILGKKYEIKNLRYKNYGDVNEELYSRQILAFGKLGQQFLSNLKIGILGLGGSGSCIAEQLARLGVKKYLLVDYDVFETSNKTRLYGSTKNTQNIFKTTIVKNNLMRIEDDLEIIEIKKDAFDQNVLKKLLDSDFIFSCTDKHTPRGVINQLCYQYYIPVIDVGTGLRSDGNTLIDGSVRATLISPELPCLFCNEIINSETISAEQLPPMERNKRAQEGYIRDFPEINPSVISYTTTAAGMGVNLFLNYIFGISEYIKTNNMMDPINFYCLSPQKTISDCICTQIQGRSNSVGFFAPRHDEVVVEKNIFKKIKEWIFSHVNL